MPSAQILDHWAAATTRPTRLLQPWQTSSLMPSKSNSAGSDGDLAWFDLRIIGAMQSSARPGHDG
jgi:hypothetical protein